MGVKDDRILVERMIRFLSFLSNVPYFSSLKKPIQKKFSFLRFLFEKMIFLITIWV